MERLNFWKKKEIVFLEFVDKVKDFFLVVVFLKEDGDVKLEKGEKEFKEFVVKKFDNKIYVEVLLFKINFWNKGKKGLV